MPKQARPKERNMDQENRRKDGLLDNRLFIAHPSRVRRARKELVS